MTPEQLAKLGDIATLEHSDLLVLERDEWEMVLEHIAALKRELAEARELLRDIEPLVPNIGTAQADIRAFLSGGADGLD